MFTALQIRELAKKGRMDKFYNDSYWRKLSKEIIKENHNECYMCRQMQRKRVKKANCVHHVLHLCKYPEFAYQRFFKGVDGKEQIQLMPLCYSCHNNVHGRNKQKVKLGFVNKEQW